MSILSAQEAAGVTAPLAQATTLPPRAYTDPDIFRRETTTLFEREWVCVARAEQVADIGDYLCVDLLNQPLLIVRQKDRTISAMSSVCLHRAMPVAEGAGNAAHFSCPYHLWKYGLDGRLISAPMMEGVSDFPPPGCRLPAVACEVWQGFVFVNLNLQAAPLAPRLRELSLMLADYQLGELAIGGTLEFDSPWNWKLLVENFMEAYHHIGPHMNTFQPVYPAKDAYVEADPDHLWSALHMPSEFPREADNLPLLPGLPPGQHHLMACLVSPTLLFAPGDTMVAWYQLLPEAVDRMTLRIHILVHPDTAADAGYAEALAEMLAAVRFVHEEDIAVNAGPWRGVRAPLAKAGRLSLHEAAIWHMNQFWAERVL